MTHDTSHITLPRVTWLPPFANHTHLYVLAIGIAVGIVLGPGVLGRVAPDTYHTMFASAQSHQLNQLISQFQTQSKTNLMHLQGTGVSPAAVTEFLHQRDQKLATLHTAVSRAHDRRAGHLATGILLALVAVMLVETFLAPAPPAPYNPAMDDEKGDPSPTVIPASLARLTTVRYALAAAWLAVVLARPGLLWSSSIILAVIILIVALILGLTPLRLRSTLQRACGP